MVSQNNVSQVALVSASTQTVHKKNRWLNGEAILAYVFIFPSLIGFLFFFAIPAVNNIRYSFTDWNLQKPANYVGLDNYNTLIQDQDFRSSMGITVVYVLLNIPIQTVLALLIAVLMDRLHTASWLRGFFVLPWLIPNIIVGLLWLWILDPQLGIVNQMLGSLGIAHQPFLGSPTQALPSIAWINIWRHTGYTALLIFAGLKTIPSALYEAASIDGANERVAFFRITIPLLRPVLVFVLVTSVIGSFQIFDTIAITTQGGPVNATRAIYYYIYQWGFVRFKMGYASAIATVLFAILVVVTLLQMRFLNGNTADVGDYQ